MNNDFLPLLIIPAVPYKNGIRFLHQNHQIDISTKHVEKIWNVIEHCNGYNSVQRISELATLPLEEVSSIIIQLQNLEIIVDSRKQYLHFHKVSNYPTPFNCNLTQDEIYEYTKSPRKPVKDGEVFKFLNQKQTPLITTRRSRRSCRNFSEEKLTIDQIGNICNFAYSIPDHSVPSGGALYPLKIYLTIEKDQKGMVAGYYEYDAENDTFILFNNTVDTEQLKYCFNSEELPFGSSVQIIIAADLDRQPYKYSNRGYRLTLIEVGHVAENICLFCAENGLGACEMGGILDEALMNELELTDYGIWPIIAIPIGYESKVIKQSAIDKMRYIENNVGSEKPVTSFWANTFENHGSFFGVTSAYKSADSTIEYAGATSTSYVDATFKAIIEGYERWRSGQVRVDYYGSANSLKNWLHPKLIAPLTKDQTEKCGVAYFTKHLEIPWTRGINFDGSEIYVPSDIVYYGQESKKNRICFSHSSGIAAFSNYKEAQTRALIELIERDALMRNWFLRESPNIISKSSLPIHAQKRITHWEKYNRSIKVLEMPSAYGRVILAIIKSEEYPFFVSGAAATIYEHSTEITINKAIQEAEYQLLLSLRYPDENNIIDPKSVHTPMDHGALYHLEQYAKTLNWLWSGKVVDNFTKLSGLSIDELILKLEVVTVDMSEKNADLSVVRVFSPKLIPINFGFNSAHYSHPEIVQKVNPNSIDMPHYFA